MKEKKEKNQRLEEKVNKLVEKLEEKIEEIKSEKSPVKRLRYIIKCKMLVSKIQRQQDLLKARRNFEKLKEDNNITTKESKRIARQNIIKINEGIDLIEKFLRKNKKFDIDSPNFMFPKKEVKRLGGVQQYADALDESQEPKQIKIAKRIRDIEQYKAKLEDLYERLDKNEQYLLKADSNLKTKNNRISRNEMMVTVKSKFNIFAKIRNLASSVSTGVKEMWEEFKESRAVNKELDEQKADYLNMIQENYEKEKDTIEEEYQQKMQALEERYGEMEENSEISMKEKKEERTKTRRNKQSAKFQEQLQNMARPVQEEPNLPSEEDIIRQTEEYEKSYDKEQDEEVYNSDAVITQDDDEIGI